MFPPKLTVYVSKYFRYIAVGQFVINPVCFTLQVYVDLFSTSAGYLGMFVFESVIYPHATRAVSFCRGPWSSVQDSGRTIQELLHARSHWAATGLVSWVIRAQVSCIRRVF